MSKSKRLMELMIAVNKKRKFTVRELAEEFQVSKRTIMRDLQVLDELGLPLYAEYGPHGGYRVLNERLLPPIMFSEQEAVAMFFAYQSLQHYGALPFHEEAASALTKFYYYLPEDTKQKIDIMKHRVVFWSPKRQIHAPYLRLLLDAAMQQRPLQVTYDSKEGAKERVLQPVGVYSHNGFWYSPAFCFLKNRLQLFRADRLLHADWAAEGHPVMDISGFPISDWFQPPDGRSSSQGRAEGSEKLQLEARLTKEAVRRFRWEAWFEREMVVEENGEGRITLSIHPDEIGYFAQYFAGLGPGVVVEKPAAVISEIRNWLIEQNKAYGL
ncbi:helix-turn-helix transcriptional regulator [Paenibacillus puerhi]|uniref:helix-turn-helix transcriptional regulator n=1 Tax=Paenibacillus puerhi TaxID=2692622 RepID=UPI00135BA341|nr:YafY family protein [Paenibacillus puerhi]